VFATTEMKLPQAEDALHSHLGDKYTDGEWRPALKAVMDAEDDPALALTAIKKLQLNAHLTAAAHPPPVYTDQCWQLEADLLNSITELKKRNWIHGDAPTLENILNLVEELEIGDSLYQFEGGDADIIAEVLHEQAVAQGDIMEIASDSEGEEENGKGLRLLSNTVMMELCQQLEASCLEVDAECALDLSRNLCCFRAHLRQSKMKNAKQVTLDSLWVCKE
jgi:hypothetical protein